ncbi:MAG TPA: glycosyltransferase 87 family protein [Gaiellaceae bacterium]|nr:glycosyltransferase 87 family protein [Gaiellaceae bacterium]
MFALTCALPHVGIFRGHIDTSLFQSYGDRTLHGEVPYRDFSLEYPPGALPAFVVPSLGPARDYDAWFSAFEVAGGLACILFVALALAGPAVPDRRLYAAVSITGLAPLALGPLALHRYDLYAAAFAMGAVAALVHRRRRLGFAALGLGTAAKIFPVVLVPLAYLHVARRIGVREARRGLLAFAVALAVVVLPFVALSPGGVRFSLARQTGRALQIETLGSSLLLGLHALGGYATHPSFGSGSWNLTGGLPDALAALQTVLQVAAVVLVWLVFARGSRGREQLLVGSAAAVAVWVLFGKVLSPQYLLWLVPLVAVVVGRSLPKLAVPAVLVAAIGLTHAVYPNRYDELIRLDTLPIVLLLARNALLVVLAAALVLRLYREGGTQPVDRSFQTDAQAKPARPEAGTASGA